MVTIQSMKKTTLTKTGIARKLGISSQAISNWESDGKIPAEACINLEPIIKIGARKLFLKPSLLFDKFKKRANKVVDVPN